MHRLRDITPDVSVSHILEGMIPPPQFSDATFESYYPDPGEPSQLAARDALAVFSTRINRGEERKSRKIFSRAQPPELRPGVYLDGGFGVGKTHLLAALWNSTNHSAKSFGTFVEYTNIIGLLGFHKAVSIFSASKLVCIDEFELDDPGDTVLLSTFLGALVEAGVYLAATSNTLPDRLGEERFAAEDFAREIQGLSARFDTIRIEGPDYRHRDLSFHTEPLSTDQVIAAIEGNSVGNAVITDWQDLLIQLGDIHPAKYGALVESIDLLGILTVKPLRDQAQALRIVSLVDRLYDRSVPVINSGIRLDGVFSSEMLSGGYRKKYFRSLSRLAALAAEGTKVVG